MPSFLDEYLIRLGATVDQAGMAKFQNALRQATSLVESESLAMVGAFLKAETEIVAGFAAIGSAAIGLADKVAMADQEYRLFALHMYMSKDAARGLKIAMDALGQPLENLAWDKELRDRTRQLIADQRAMAVGGDFDEQMRKIRDVRFEFTRMEVELKYLGMHVVTDFMKALGLGPDDLLKKLRGFNDWVTHNLPSISDKFVKMFMPIWKDIVAVAKPVGQALKQVALAITNVVGAVYALFTGDTSIEGATFSMEKFGKAVVVVSHVVAFVAEEIALLVDLIARMVSVIGLLATGKISDAARQVKEGWQDLKAFVTSGTAQEQPYAGQETKPSLSSAATGAHGTLHITHVPGVTDESWKNLANATKGVVSPELLSSIALTESGSQGMNALSSKGAIGTMQLMPATAAQYGVDPRDPLGNLTGGTAYMRDLMKKYGGNEARAVGAYNAGPGRMDAVLAGKATLPEETKNYIAKVLGREGYSGSVQVGSVVINIQGNGDPEKVRKATVDGLQQYADKRVQRNLVQSDNLGWGY